MDSIQRQKRMRPDVRQPVMCIQLLSFPRWSKPRVLLPLMVVPGTASLVSPLAVESTLVTDSTPRLGSPPQRELLQARLAQSCLALLRAGLLGDEAHVLLPDQLMADQPLDWELSVRPVFDQTSKACSSALTVSTTLCPARDCLT